jgi:hypothetical protein
VQLADSQIFQIMNVSKHRKISGVKYPAVYAPDADAAKDIKLMRFNCAQRCVKSLTSLTTVPTKTLLRRRP